MVDITSSDQPVDTTDNEISTSVNAQKIELLPKGVNFTSVLRAAPGVRGEGLAGGFSVDGASGSENVFVIDGQEVTNFRTGTLNGNNNIPTQFVQEVQVKSSGFDAEFGGATGGVISVVTKGGSNDFRGEFGAQFNTPNLDGSPRPSLQRFTSGSGAAFTQTVEYINDIPKAQGTTFYPTANLSGPIIKDRLWFFGSYSPTITNTRVNTTFFTNAPAATRSITNREEFRLNRTFHYAFSRLDAQPVSNLRLSGTYTWNPIVDQGALPFGTVSLGGAPAVVNFGGNIGTLRGSEISNRQGGRQNSNNVTAQAVWTPSSNLVFSGRFSRGFLNEKLGNYFVPTGSRVRCQQGSTTIAGACQTGFTDPVVSQTIKDVSIRTNYEADATFLFNGLGRHELKGGYQRFRILNDVNRTTTGTGFIDLYYGFPCSELGAPITDTAGAIGCGELIRFATLGVGQNTNQSVYIQDKWQPFNRLTLNLGLRAEKEDLPSFNGLAPPINFGFGDKLAPRLGFAFDLFGNGRSKIFGSYGQFYDRLKFELPRGSFGGDFYRVDFFEIFPNSGDFRSFTPARILGSFNDVSGGRCPTTGFIASGALSRCQFDYRIASNSPEATIFTGAVDPNLKPFRQDEFTVGMEHQLASDYVVRGRYTRKEVKSAIEDAGIRNNEGSEAYIIGNPGEGLHLELLNQLGYARAATPQRQYDAFELTLEKRLSNNYYFNVNYTLSRLYGNYSGLASSDEAGRTSPGVNRFFDLPFIGFTATGELDNGRLGTDRPHVFNAYGAYIFDWFGNKTNSTEFSVFQTVQSGTPQSTLVGFIVPIFESRRGDLGRTPRFSQTDIAVSHKYRFGRDNRFTLVGDLNILNLLDQDTVTGLQTVRSAVTTNPANFGLSEIAGANAFASGALSSQINTFLQGTPTVRNRLNASYGMANAFQGPRSVRFGFRLLF
ncbi:MAG: TonB-dependent receptor plug domain-containing protein [Acidobacteria bacterium]|nr:TonB-dependent receptor plug domain-containing protein [Acidobacteriota bacterium]